MLTELRFEYGTPTSPFVTQIEIQFRDQVGHQILDQTWLIMRNQMATIPLRSIYRLVLEAIRGDY